MYDILRENLKWIILGLSAIWVFSSMASCAKDSTISNNNAQVEIVKSYTVKGYVQKKTEDGYDIIWTKPNESTVINE